jgi:hypothetical protein
MRLGGGVALFLLLCLSIFTAVAAAPLAPPAAGEGESCPADKTATATPAYQDYALLIAGLKGNRGPLAAQEATPAWVSHARVMDQTWGNFERRQLTVMRQWAAQELSQADHPAIFYPFSGPDFVNMYTLFPKASTYIMASLEPVGELPDFTAGNGSSFYPRLQRSLYDLLHLSFFITPKLAATLSKTELKGVLPVLLFFMARQGLQVEDVRYWVMKAGGGFEEAPATAAPINAGPGDLPGLRIVFSKPGASEKQTLYYMRFNLANGSFGPNQPGVAFLERFGPLTTFAKAASYLMYRPNFAAIRQFILDKSAVVLQSDAAIPVQYFDPAAWNRQFYGCYTGPIALFRNRYQPDLANLYQSEDVHPLPFGICYKHRPRTSNLMFAVKKAALTETRAD